MHIPYRKNTRRTKQSAWLLKKGVAAVRPRLLLNRFEKSLPDECSRLDALVQSLTICRENTESGMLTARSCEKREVKWSGFESLPWDQTSEKSCKSRRNMKKVHGGYSKVAPKVLPGDKQRCHYQQEQGHWVRVDVASFSAVECTDDL